MDRGGDGGVYEAGDRGAIEAIEANGMGIVGHVAHLSEARNLWRPLDHGMGIMAAPEPTGGGTDLAA